jgi:hypothetical protein
VAELPAGDSAQSELSPQWLQVQVKRTKYRQTSPHQTATEPGWRHVNELGLNTLTIGERRLEVKMNCRVATDVLVNEQSSHDGC